MNKIQVQENLAEQKLVDELCEIIHNVVTSSSYEVEHENTLDYDCMTDDIDQHETEDSENEDPTFRTNREGYFNEQKDFLQNFTLDYMIKVINFYDEIDDRTNKRKHTWKGKIYEQHGAKRNKFNEIEAHVFDMFENARENYLPAHDLDLRRWALQKAKEISLGDFSASAHWVLMFKRRHNIVSRKVTKLVTRKTANDSEEIVKLVDKFIDDIRGELNNYRPEQVLNTDQVGLSKELHSRRTLTYKGEKTTVGVIQSHNAITHSYTIQPMISLAGHVVGPIYLCLQEPSGRFGERVKENLFRANNVIVTCSKSGKLDTTLVQCWFDHVFLPSTPRKSLLISDSWTGHKDPNIYAKSKGCKRVEIPKNTTDQIQPLDVFYNRQMKSIIRKMYDRVMLDQLSISLMERNNIIQLISLVHSQMSAPIFQNLIRYAWYASGYLDKHPGSFQTVKDVCFSLDGTTCQHNNCDSSPFIQCSWCRKILCFDDFFLSYHIH
ncbi:unnamed protein product [Rotaria magnacalcarata]|uniref:HTH CENPB-type domain-containing protein n=1 Tax=Rotaria magnacalcarata TaxID=392030 RepID=A0A816M3I9_9BILA|nr:unnamed protein product [Rotaria magnacalcarata]